MSLRVNNDVYTMFTDVCNNEGVTISQKLNRLVTDCTTLPCKTENKVEPLEEELKPRKTLDQKIRVLDSKNRKENEPEFNQSKDGLGKFMKSLMNDSRKNNHNYNQDLVKLAFAPYLKDLKQSIADLNMRFDTKIDEDKT